LLWFVGIRAQKLVVARFDAGLHRTATRPAASWVLRREGDALLRKSARMLQIDCSSLCESPALTPGFPTEWSRYRRQTRTMRPNRLRRTTQRRGRQRRRGPQPRCGKPRCHAACASGAGRSASGARRSTALSSSNNGAAFASRAVRPMLAAAPATPRREVRKARRSIFFIRLLSRTSP